MSHVTNQILITIISAAIISAVGYIFVVKENQLKIQQLEQNLAKESASMTKSVTAISQKLDDYYGGIQSNIGESRSTIDAIKLFIVAAHPDREHISLAASTKLQTLSSSQLNVLAAGLKHYKDDTLFNVNFAEHHAEFTQLITNKEMTKADLAAYVKALDISK